MLALPGVQALIEFHEQQYLMDTGNLLAVPALLLQRPTARLTSDEQFLAESCVEFMLRGYWLQAYSNLVVDRAGVQASLF
jgi:hypothetical protein